jgi:hypothetical protein
MKRALGILVFVCVIGGCGSPETTRTRGGGPGADVNNRPKTVKMHEGSEPFWKTPEITAGGRPPLDSARQAQQLSRQ